MNTAFGDISVAPIFSNNMVLQREVILSIWGTGTPGEAVKLQFRTKIFNTKVNSDGKWILTIPPQTAGGPYEMLIIGSSNKILIKNILFGEVWLCSGQSNMEFTVKCLLGSNRPSYSNNSNIRLFTVRKIIAGQEATPFTGYWKESTANNINDFSAIAYFFGQILYQQLQVPIGLIDASIGGTAIIPWISPQGYQAVKGAQTYKKHEERRLEEHSKPQHNFFVSWFKKLLKQKSDSSVADKSQFYEIRKPSYLFAQMIEPMSSYRLRGILWYQGEADVGDDTQKYFNLMQALITGWRAAWQETNLPFYFVQIAPYNYTHHIGKLPFLWQAQLKTLVIPNTGMVVTNDNKDLENLHPQNKYDVAHRLALWALAKTYHYKNIEYSGPLYENNVVQDNKIFLHFSHVGKGLKSRDGKSLTWFEIAGKDGKFIPANADIVDHNTIKVYSDKISKPIAARFAWDQIAQPNLENSSGLPASAFLTQD